MAFIADGSDVTEAMIPYFKTQEQAVPIVAYDVATTVDELLRLTGAVESAAIALA